LTNELDNSFFKISFVLVGNCSFCRPKKGLPSTGQLSHKAQKGGYYSVSHYLGDVIVLDDGTWKVAPQAAKFRYKEAGDVSEDEEDPEMIDELADDESDKADDSGKKQESAEDAEKVDEVEEDEEEIDEIEEDSVPEREVTDKTNSNKAATNEDAKVKNVLLARKSDDNAVTSTITSEKSDAVESKTECKAKVEEKGKVSN